MSEFEKPDWFDVEKYTCKPRTGDEMYEAVQAVLDRVPFLQIMTTPGFDPARIPEERCRDALAIVRKWSANPYVRPREDDRLAIHACLAPGIQMDNGTYLAGLRIRSIRTYKPLTDEAVLYRWPAFPKAPASEGEGAASWFADFLKKEDQKNEAGEFEASDVNGGWNAPSYPNWVPKLFEYRIAAHIDLMLLATLEGEPLEIKRDKGIGLLHEDHFPCEAPTDPDQRTVLGLLEALRDANRTPGDADRITYQVPGGVGHVKLLSRAGEKSTYKAWLRNRRRSKKGQKTT